jgi:putative ABC transport system permease protein
VTRYLTTLLFGVKPIDTVTFIAVAVVLAAVVFVACLVPARRAAKIDPLEALR